MLFLRKCPDYRSINLFVRLYSLARKNHYDVLKLRKNCSDKEIKEAYIQMSKQYHPDKNKDAKAQEKFVQIVEAYNVLSKPSSRAQYDNLTKIYTGPSNTNASYVYKTYYDPYNSRVRNHANYNYYYETTAKKAESSSTKEKPSNEWYYGFSGVKKLPNYYIICLCVGIAFVGVLLQLYVIRNMYTMQRSKAQEKSMRIAEELERVRSAAKDNGNELQTRILLDRIVAAANPTVTTASLGQALANEKKNHSDSLLTEFGIGEATDGWYDVKPNDDVQGWYKLKFTCETW